MSELRKLRDAALADVPPHRDRTMHDAIASTFGDKSADYVIHLLNNADKYAGMEERIAELESQLEASLGALREQMKARRDACARLGAVEGGLRIAAIYVRAALQGDGGQE